MKDASATTETPEVGRERWYNVQQAAEYLGVSQPTVYRWVKQGLLSFYKIGGSTRFSLEGLDAVIEKTTGHKEARAASGRCAACGHATLVEGNLRGAGKLYFRPAHARFWVLDEAFVGTRARVCPACGYLQMHVDTEKLGRLMPRDNGEGGSR